MANQQNLGELIAGLRRLRTGALISLIAVILIIVSLSIIFFSVGFFMPGLGASPYPPMAMIAMITGTVMFSLVVIGAAAVLGLIAYILWFMAAGHLKRYNMKWGIGRLGMTLQIIALAIIALALIIILPTAIIGGFKVNLGVFAGFAGIMFVGGILWIVGAILFAIMLIRLPEEPKIDSGFKIAGILYLLGLIISLIPTINIVGLILSIVAVIMIYTSSGNSLKIIQQ